MKKYFVLVMTKLFTHSFETNSWKWAKRIADLKIWRYAKIQDNNTGKTIYISMKKIV